MRRALGVLVLAVLAGGLLATPAAAEDVDVRGRCSSGRTEWRLRVEPDDGQVELRFEINQHRPSTDAFDVVITCDGATVFSGVRVGRGADGEFRVRRLLADTAGTDVWVATATNQVSGVTCQGTATA